MKIQTLTITAFTSALASTAAFAHDHPQMNGPMKHVNISLDGDQISVEIDESVATPVLEPLPEDHAYSDPTYQPLNGTAHNNQYGWNPNGLFRGLEADESIWVERLGESDGLMTYEANTMNPLFGTDGSSELWQWNGSMVHNWDAIDESLIAGPSESFANYRVFVGDDQGQAVAGYGSDTVRLDFIAVPEPGSLAVLCLGAAAVGLRRRRRA